MIYRLIIYTLMLLCGHLSVLAQQTSYYGHDMLTAIREEYSTEQCNIIQLAGGINIRECDSAKTSYTVSDHLGSTRVILDASLANKVSCDYDTYGHISLDVPESLREQCRYTHTYRWNNATQLYQSPTRVYQSVAKRFLSLDPQKQGYSDYQYAFSNSIRYTDVSGAINVDEVKEIIKDMQVFQELHKMPSETRMVASLKDAEVMMPFTPEWDEFEKKMESIEERTKMMREEQSMFLDRSSRYTFLESYKKLVMSGGYKDIVFKHGVANCGECAGVMYSELHKRFPELSVEQVHAKVDEEIFDELPRFKQDQISQLLDHTYVILNRDKLTPIENPAEWNQDAIVVDAWTGDVLSRDEYITATSTPGHIYNITDVYPDAKIKNFMEEKSTYNKDELEGEGAVSDGRGTPYLEYDPAEDFSSLHITEEPRMSPKFFFPE